jgi:hypothetical protein
MEVAMRGRKLSFLGAMVVAIAVAFVVSPSVAGQAGPATSKAASASALPRTPDGHPDLQGIYEIATITPIERPANVNGRLALTEKEAAALARAEQTRVETAAQPSAVDRGSPAIGARVGGYNNFWIARGSQAIVVDGQRRSSIIIDPPDGKIPAFTAEARQRNANSRFRNNPSADAAETAVALDPRAYDDPEQRPLGERCLLGFGSTSGPPTLPNYFYNNLKQIVQTPDTILIQVEMVHDARLIRMNAQHLPPAIHRWMGDSVGHWEGDTLVVDTTNFTDKTRFRGSSENLHVVERIWRVDDKTLMYRFTVDDPTTWVKPWTGEYPWPATDEHMFEYACHEGNYALGDILRGARGIEAEEAAAAAAKKTSSR